MRYLLFLLFAFATTFGHAQDTLTAPKIDTTEITLKKSKIYIIKKKDEDNKTIDIEIEDEETHEHKPKKRKNTDGMWSGLQLGTNTIIAEDNYPSFLDLDGSKNRSFAINPFSRRWDLGTPHVGFSTGLGLAFNRYALNRNVKLQYNADEIWATEDTINDYTKNHFKTIHLTAPILLEFNAKKRADDGFRMAIGLEAGYLLGARTKTKYKVDNKKQVDKTKGNFNLSPFRVSPIVLIGYRDISFYAKVSGTELFLADKGPEKLYHASAGLFINFN